MVKHKTQHGQPNGTEEKRRKRGEKKRMVKHKTQHGQPNGQRMAQKKSEEREERKREW
jgi:hypothetical protein